MISSNCAWNHIQPAQCDDYVSWFEEGNDSASQVAKGVVIVGSFVGCQQDENQFVWICRFDSEEARERFELRV